MAQFIAFLTKLNSKTTTGYGLIRIFLGIALFIRGAMILLNPQSIIELGVGENYFIYVSLIGFAHTIGGLLLFLGYLTRIAALIQIPILISAIFYVHVHTELMMGGQSLELAVLVLFLLCIYFIYGSGKLSIADIFRKRNFSF